MAHTEHEIILGAGVNDGFGPLLREGQGLLTEDMFPGGNGALDLLGVERMWRGKDNGLDPRMLEGLRVTGVVPEAIGCREFLAGRIGLRGAGNLDIVLCLLQHGGHLLAPPAEANHRDVDGSALIHLEIST